MRGMKDIFLVLIASAALIFATGCADDSPSTESSGAGGAGASTGAGGAGGAAGEGGAGGEGGAAGEGGAGGTGGAAGEGGMGGGEPPQCDDTAPLAETAVNEYGPATRVTSLEIPRRPDEADELGCATVGSNNGTGLSSLVSLLGVSLSSLTEPDPETGEIEVVLLGKMAGWEAGQTAGATSGLVLELFQGEATADGFAITSDSFVDGDPANGPQISFPASIDECSMVSTEAADFAFSLPVDALTIDLTLSAAKLGGTIRAEETGFSMLTSSISGYLTVSSVVALLTALQEVCDGSDEQPDLCDGAGMFLSGDPEMLANTLVLPLLRGADSTVNADGTVAEGCDEACASGDTCECAVSVCLAIESTATTITGIAE